MAGFKNNTHFFDVLAFLRDIPIVRKLPQSQFQKLHSICIKKVIYLFQKKTKRQDILKELKRCVELHSSTFKKLSGFSGGYKSSNFYHEGYDRKLKDKRLVVIKDMIHQKRIEF